ncbi:beta-glucosidase [Ruminococcus sp. AF18-22]|nr:beta-glucosidase [Ruminococcus sp. AF18-22]
MGFKRDFLWGASSAAYQIEGAWNEDGKGASMWDVLSEKPGIMAHGESGKIASDHYHHWKEDVALMKKIGLKSYRFSISWSRVLPQGVGTVNPAGIKFYSDLVDELIKVGIKPVVTLYHWDLPYALYEKGGWKNPMITEWFAEYVTAVVEALSDRVEYWITINEPQMFIGLGYLIGAHAPFEKHDPTELISISHNVLKAHGTAVRVIRKYAKLTPKIGMAPTGDVYLPEDWDAESVKKAKERSFDFDPYAFTMENSWWADPVFLGDYPKKAYEIYPEEMKIVTDEDRKLISEPLDFYGFNAYNGTVSFKIDDGYSEYGYQGSPKTSCGWDVTPEVLYWSPKFLYERYKTPLFVTENGMAGMDWVSLDGKVHDMQRMDYLHRYLLELRKAVDEGIPVIGYSCWSLLDNMEWNRGYDMRFGLIYVDYRTMKRTMKDSAYFYQKVIISNGEEL